MAEFIEREAVMQKFADHVRRSNNSDFAPVPTWNQAVQIVADFTAADVRPVVRGFNVSKAYPSLFECSVCGWSDGDTTTGDTRTYNFCPNCGADMREES